MSIESPRPPSIDLNGRPLIGRPIRFKWPPPWREAVAVDDRDGVRQRVTTRKARRLLRREITPHHRTLDVGGAQAPPAAIYATVGVWKRDEHASFLLGSDVIAMVELV